MPTDLIPSSTDRIRGGIYGLLVADALGVPYEFHDASEIPPLHAIEMTPPPGFHRAHGGVPTGTWSDDGAQALVLLESLIRCRGLAVDDLGYGLLAWLDQGRYAVDSRVFDVGIQTNQALSRIRSGQPAATAGATDARANGNGSLMRVLPLIFGPHAADDAQLIKDAFAQSAVTHGHLRSQVACAVYCLWARRILDGAAVDRAWQDAREAFENRYAAGSPERAELDVLVPADGQWADRGTGYVVDSLRAALTLTGAIARPGSPAEQPLDYETVVRRAIALGDDTDTTACIAGGIAGLVVGEHGIPQRWRDALRGRDLVEPLLATLG
ncbi:MAG TPA: ADP-ribosylglycohydrolase family protein [Dermatophilaceae bacterium]|jgi:ADP-ribosyl-[dinitrogen reductase] hydrolase|nr:ADP-ribosylglycohydrolase family protein [Dermatophilaceae bacterium]HMT88409.1 ADP-ribosylglycohydrolase family protein [Dermatophilaceae bacterium]